MNCKSCGNTIFTIMDSDWNKREGTGYRVSCNECHMDYWIPESVAKAEKMKWYNSEFKENSE